MNVLVKGPVFRVKVGGNKATERTAEELPRVLPCCRVGQSDDIAQEVCFLAFDDATYINGRPLLVVDGLSRLNAFSLMQT